MVRIMRLVRVVRIIRIVRIVSWKYGLVWSDLA